MTDAWNCDIHGFYSHSKAQFLEHMKMQDHYHEGTSSSCESCGKFLPVFKSKYTDINEPRIDLCERCQQIPDIYNIIRDKRNGIFNKLPTGVATI